MSTEQLATAQVPPMVPKVLLVGPKRSGKSSIRDIVFERGNPNEAFLIESTTTPVSRIYPFEGDPMQFELIDCPGSLDYMESLNLILPGTGKDGKIHEPLGLILVLDAQDEDTFRDACESFVATAVAARKVCTDVTLSVLVHKMDADSGLADEARQENLSTIRLLIHEGMQRESISHVPVHPTSIFDHTTFEAISRILQRILPHVNELEKLLNSFVVSCSLNKAVIFDISSKLYFASDRSPMDMQVYVLCNDMIEVVLDMSSIYDPRCRPDEEKMQKVFAGMDEDAKSVIRLSNNYLLYFRHITHGLVLVCLLNKESYSQPGLLEQNFSALRANILGILDTSLKSV